VIRDTTRKTKKKLISAEDSQLDDSAILRDLEIQTRGGIETQESQFSKLLQEIEKEKRTSPVRTPQSLVTNNNHLHWPNLAVKKSSSRNKPAP